MRTLVLAILTTLIAVPVHGQWINEPAKGIPRTPDGRPNFSALAPRGADGRPDLSGLWLTPLHPGYVANIAADLEAADVLPLGGDAVRSAGDSRSCPGRRGRGR